MDLSAALTQVHTLLDGAGVDHDATTASLAALTDNLERAVPSYLGLQLVLVQHDHPVTLTEFDPAVQPADVATSLHLPLTLLGIENTDPASRVSFYAATPGAFVDLAADLTHTLQRSDGTTGPRTVNDTTTTITLDHPLQPTTTTSGLTGAAELSTIRRAIGILIGNGHRLDDAHTELARQAAAADVTILARATELVRPTQPPAKPSRTMKLDQRFMAAVLAALETDDHPTEVLPAVLARACVQVLPVAGAGISCTDDLRIPLGASDQLAVRAERLQTTLGEGPCLTATHTSTPLRATGPDMAQRWPIFHHELIQQTPYRTIASIPLQAQLNERFGALDLYSTDENAFSDLVLDQICAEVADPIAAILFDHLPTTNQQNQNPPTWLASHTVMDRMTVWIAIGMLMEDGVLTNTHALSVLRGYAYTHNTTLDELATQLTTHQLTPQDILDS